jgi:hypothetical protein
MQEGLMLLVQTLSHSCPCHCSELKFLFYNRSVTWTNRLNLCLDVSLLGILQKYFLFVIYVVILPVAQIIVFNVVTISEGWFRKDIKGAALPALKHYPIMMIVREGTKNFRIASVLVSIWTRTSWTVVISVTTLA